MTIELPEIFSSAYFGAVTGKFDLLAMVNCGAKAFPRTKARDWSTSITFSQQYRPMG